MADGAIVLAGGGSRRLGRDKLAEEVGGIALLDRVLQSVADLQIVAVGSPRPTAVAVRWVSEDPSGSGPCAAVLAGVAALHADVDTVLVLAGDHPFLGTLPHTLLAAVMEQPTDVAYADDGSGYPQPLLAAYQRSALDAARARLGSAVGAPARSLLEGLRVTAVASTSVQTLDCDVETDLDRAKEVLDGTG